MPVHEWNGSQLRFRDAVDSWGDYADLRGPQGVPGERGAVGAQGAAGPQGPAGAANIDIPNGRAENLLNLNLPSGTVSGDLLQNNINDSDLSDGSIRVETAKTRDYRSAITYQYDLGESYYIVHSIMNIYADRSGYDSNNLDDQFCEFRGANNPNGPWTELITSSVGRGNGVRFTRRIARTPAYRYLRFVAAVHGGNIYSNNPSFNCHFHDVRLLAVAP
jgi:hypothetical protein